MVKNPYATPSSIHPTNRDSTNQTLKNRQYLRDYAFAAAGGIYIFVLFIGLVAEHAYHMRLVGFREFITVSDWWAACGDFGLHAARNHYIRPYTKVAICGAIVAICFPTIRQKISVQSNSICLWFYFPLLLLNNGWLGLIFGPLLPLVLLSGVATGEFGIDGESLSDGIGQLTAVGLWSYAVLAFAFAGTWFTSDTA